MTRKSKQPGAHQPLTYHERTKKFASSEYGTVRKRLAGHSQYQIGECALTVSPIDEDTALCSPSGYLYAESAILEYLLVKTQELKQQQKEYDESQERAVAEKEEEQSETQKRKIADFRASQKTVAKKAKVVKDGGDDTSKKEAAVADLKRVSYWLADAQPNAASAADFSTTKSSTTMISKPPPDRPGSPITGSPLRRKDLWPVQLTKLENKLVCAVSQKNLGAANCIAYWTDNKNRKKDQQQPPSLGTIVLESVYQDLIVGKSSKTPRCPVTDAKIRHTRRLQRSGSSFAASGQSVEVQKYRPTLT